MLTGNTALYGFDSGPLAVYGPSWHDVMTYCDNQWVSDFTYEALLNQLKSEGGSAPVFLPVILR